LTKSSRVKELFYMKHFKLVGLCLVAAFGMSAVAATTALASEGPIFSFPNGGGAKPDFSSVAGGGKFVTTASGEKVTIECTAARNTGVAVAGTDRVEKVVITFTGCTEKIKEATVKCGAAPSGANETITTNSLSGQLGYLHVGTPLTVGLILKSESELFAEFKCSLDTVKVRGREIKEKEFAGIIAEVLPESLNKLIDPGTAGLLTYKQEPAGEPKQALRELTVLGTPIKELLLTASTGGGAFELAGLEEEKNVELFFLESVLLFAPEGPTLLFPNGGGAKPDFSSLGGRGKFVTTASGATVTIECTTARNTGVAVAGTDRVEKVVITFTGCTAKIKGATLKCGAAPSGANETITTNSLSGQFGYLHLGTPLTVGLVLKSESELFAEFKCSLNTIKVRGREIKEKEFAGIIAEVLPESLNKLIDPGTAGLLSYKQEPAGEPKQALRELTVLGALVKELLLTVSTGGGAFELAGLEEEKNVELFFLESFLISA
jgi:hypothetical protein